MQKEIGLWGLEMDPELGLRLWISFMLPEFHSLYVFCS